MLNTCQCCSTALLQHVTCMATLTIQVKHLRIRLPAGILPHCPYSTPQIGSMHHDRIADLTFRRTSAILAAIPAQRPSALPLHLYDPSRRQVIFFLQMSSICRVPVAFQVLLRRELRFYRRGMHNDNVILDISQDFRAAKGGALRTFFLLWCSAPKMRAGDLVPKRWD